MRVLILYFTTVLIWGSTWFVITLQIDLVDPLVSVAWRFYLSAAILFGFCLVTGKRLRYSLRDHLFIAGQGISLFGAGYCLCYLATVYLTSGLVSIVFAMTLIFNVIHLRIFYHRPIRIRAVWGGGFGLLGICLIFWEDLVSFKASPSLTGFLLVGVSTYLASLANIITVRNHQAGVPVTQANAYGMLYGATATLLYCLLTGIPVTMSWTWEFGLPLIYLALFGSVVAFGCYMTLIGLIGADTAAYVGVLSPVLALAISTFMEGYTWTAASAWGTAVAILGNVIILTPTETLNRWLPFGGRGGSRQPVG